MPGLETASMIPIMIVGEQAFHLGLGVRGEGEIENEGILDLMNCFLGNLRLSFETSSSLGLESFYDNHDKGTVIEAGSRRMITAMMMAQR